MSIFKKIQRVQETLDDIHQDIKKNVCNKKNKDGFFRQAVAEYLACLEVKSAKLESLFYKDQLQWIERADDEKRKAGAFTDKLKEFVERQSRELATILKSNYKSES